MALNIKDADAERLAADVARMTGESKTRAVRIALAERLERLTAADGATRAERLRRFLETEAWPQIPAGVRGRTMTREERERILGYGPHGV